MNAYLQIIKATWAEYLVYRLNFVMWRVRMVMQLLVTYFLWLALSGTGPAGTTGTLFGYTQTMILTYVLLTSVVRTMVLSTTTMEIGDVINQGNLSNYLVKPMSVFAYYGARDVADKALNLFFAIGEFGILLLVLQPSLFLQTNMVYIGLSVFAVLLGILMYFYFSLILGFLGFWTPDVWGPRFISFVVMEFFAGSLFPLDILPKTLYEISTFLPFSFFIYFPIKIYMGQLDIMAIVMQLGVGAAWVAVLYSAARMLWHKGLLVYTSEGK